MNSGLRLPRNQYDSTLVCKKQGSSQWHEFKTEEVSKIPLWLSCQSKLGSPWGYSCLCFQGSVCCLPYEQEGAAKWKQQLLPAHANGRSSTSMAVSAILLFVDLEETLIGTMGAARFVWFARSVWQDFCCSYTDTSCFWNGSFCGLLYANGILR